MKPETQTREETMPLNTKQKVKLADVFSSIGVFILTTVAIGSLVYVEKAIEPWLLLSFSFCGVFMIWASVRMLKGVSDKSEQSNLNADIRKAIFHVKDAKLNIDK